MDNILFIDKPKGISSFDVIRELRKRLGIRKMGHAGTLDPLATGLLIVGLGSGTAKLKDFFGLPKTYRLSVLLGKRTDTGDIEGTVIEETEVRNVLRNQAEQALSSMTGELELPIPSFSAAKYRGKPRYAYARQGIAIPPKMRKTSIQRLGLLAIRRQDNETILEVELECGSGTYARSVAEEIGRRLGVPATLADLRRTNIGNIDVSQAKRLSEIGVANVPV